ncbi:MAG: DUF484 family protein [Alphaproteobacteria bacterium]|nr:DUF484 family protein [Alphaproteobacteria bacterium]
MAKHEDAAKAEYIGASPEEVIDFLRHHPEFLLDHIDLLPSPPPRWDAESVVDFQHFLVQGLREQLDRLRGCTDELLVTTRSNMSTQSRIHAAVLAMLDAEGLDGLYRVIADDLTSLLDLDITVLCFEPGGDYPQIWPMATLETGDVDDLMGDREVLLRERVNGDPRLFGEEAELVRSDALVRIRMGADLPEGVLALGTRVADAFHPGQGTELLFFLARVLESSVRRWLTAAE